MYTYKHKPTNKKQTYMFYTKREAYRLFKDYIGIKRAKKGEIIDITRNNLEFLF